jgi:BON domain-containing protein
MAKRERSMPGGQAQSERRRVRDGMVGAFFGAAAAYFGDPDNGRRRRSVARDRGLALVRRTSRRTARAGRGVAAEAYGVSEKVQHLKEEPKEFDDVTLARKVETEIFRDPEVPKGQINVNAANGVVSLRGEVQRRELIDELVERTRKVQGVRDVENLLHAPGAPSSTWP